MPFLEDQLFGQEEELEGFKLERLRGSEDADHYAAGTPAESERLSRDEVEQLLTVRKIVSLTTLSGDGTYELRAGSTVGPWCAPPSAYLSARRLGS
jgi:hypothetical protein